MRDPAVTSAVMAHIRKTDTGPELMLRRALCDAGLRGYRLYRRVPGRPDITFGKARVAVFVDGCFWHQCPSCRIPVPQTLYWQTKIARNVERDHSTDATLSALGWRVLRLWEHDVRRNPSGAAQRVKGLLRSRQASRPRHPANPPLLARKIHSR
jgi:DNA mismatch endonuclease (patch repair protein)